MRRHLHLALIAALALGFLSLSARPAQAHVSVRPAGMVTVYAAAPHLVLPLARATYYGGDLVVFYDAGYWWTIVDDQLYVTYEDAGRWVLYLPYTVTTVRPHFGYAYGDACYRGVPGACRQWYTQVRYDYRYRPHYRSAQQRYWNERGRTVITHRPQPSHVDQRGTRTVSTRPAVNGNQRPGGQRNGNNGNHYGQGNGNGGNNGNHYGQGNGNGNGGNNGNHYGQGNGNNGNHNGWSNGNGQGNGNGNGRGNGKSNGRGNGRAR